MKLSEIHYPATIAELLKLLSETPDLMLLAGGTAIAGAQTSRVFDLPGRVASIARMPELRKTIRSEQYLEVGSCTTLTGLLGLAPGLLPAPLPEVIAGIASHAIRNFATIGGNLCVKQRFMDLWPYLACIDAQIELHSATGSRWASASHLADDHGKPALPQGALLSRIRIPFHTYDFIYKITIGRKGYPSARTAQYVLMANRANGKIDSLRLIYAGERAFRSRDLEQLFAGRKLSSNTREISSFKESYLAEFNRSEVGDPTLFKSLLDESFARLCK